MEVFWKSAPLTSFFYMDPEAPMTATSDFERLHVQVERVYWSFQKDQLEVEVSIYDSSPTVSHVLLGVGDRLTLVLTPPMSVK